MQGTMEWAAFSALGGIVAAAIVLAWFVRGMLAVRDLDIQLLIKDVRHLKNNFEQHKIAASEEHDNLIRVQSEVQRLGKIVNGKH